MWILELRELGRIVVALFVWAMFFGGIVYLALGG